jgi:hypothetical protein
MGAEMKPLLTLLKTDTFQVDSLSIEQFVALCGIRSKRCYSG